MKITDSHTHIFPPKIASAAVNATGNFYKSCDTEATPFYDKMANRPGTPEDLVQALKEGGVDRAVVFSCATTTHQVESINSFIHEECLAHPEFIGVGTMYIDYPDFEAECDRLLSMGIHGIKLHPDIQRFAIDDPKLMSLYEIMASKNMFLIAHTGDPRFDYSGPHRVRHLALEFPGLDIVGAHFAGFSEWELARELLRLNNIYMDTSSTIPFAGYEPAVKGFETFDNSRIFFGSDYPMWDPGTEKQTILRLGLSDRVLEMVFSGNLDAFLARHGQ